LRRVFVDTSAIIAMVDTVDTHHAAAAATFDELMRDRVSMVTHQYVVVEAMALVHRRLGRAVVGRVVADLLPILDVVPIDMQRHGSIVATWLDAAKTGISLVDAASFDVMRGVDLHEAFAFDRDFRAAGFGTIPA